jgi:Domain of unknown function (DUF4267)
VRAPAADDRLLVDSSSTRGTPQRGSAHLLAGNDVVMAKGDGTTMVPTKIGYGLSGLVGLGITVIGARFLWKPQVAAAQYGLASAQEPPDTDPYLATKGVRDIALGVVVFVLLAARQPHILGRFMVAASIIPVGDGIIVLRRGGSKATAFGVHEATAAGMLGAAALLLTGPR